jgi:hypothetical protein
MNHSNAECSELQMVDVEEARLSGGALRIRSTVD